MDHRPKVLEHIQVSHAALEAAKKELDKKAEEKKLCAELAKEAAAALVKHERIGSNERAKAAAMLSNPVEALKILARTADPGTGLRPSAIGAPTTTKNANTSVVPAKSEADLAYESRLSQ